MADDSQLEQSGLESRAAEQLAEAQRLAHLGSWEWNIERDVVTWSDEMYRIYGLEPASQSITYEFYRERIHPDDRHLAHQVVSRSLRTGEPFSYEHRVIRPDGAERFIHARGRVIHNDSGDAIRMIGTGQDITERKASEIALRDAVEEVARRQAAEAAAAHMNRIFAQAPVVIAILRGPDHVFETVNDKYLQIAARKDVVGRSVRDALPEMEAQGFVGLLDRVYHTGEPFIGTGMPASLSPNDPSLPVAYFNFVFQPLVENGSVYGIMVVAAEVTEQVTAKEAAEAARRAAEVARSEAQAASQAKTDFLAKMSHELRTPLAAIIGYGDLLAAEIPGSLNDDQKKHVGRIKASANHLLAIIDEILTISRAEAGKERVEREPVDVNDLIEYVGSMTQPLAVRKGLDFSIAVPEETLTIETDPIKLRQVLLNLLSNAINYTESGGVELRAEKKDGMVRLSVADTGVGVNPEHIDRIFEPFWQAEGTTTRRVGGTGLGLAVTRQFVEILGGRIEVHSEVERGSIFTVSIPEGDTPSRE